MKEKEQEIKEFLLNGSKLYKRLSKIIKDKETLETLHNIAHKHHRTLNINCMLSNLEKINHIINSERI